MHKNDCLITNGIVSPLQNVKFHGHSPLTRILMSGLGTKINFNMHIAVHEITEDLIFDYRDYSKKHKHNCDERNIILRLAELTFEIVLDEEISEVTSLATFHSGRKDAFSECA